jgi:GTP cyclohydrolase FolE2
MDTQQVDQYQALIGKWKRAVERYGTGWDEDGPEIPVNFLIDVDMVNYTQRGLFAVSDASLMDTKPAEDFLFSNPVCDVKVRVGKVKAHMSRMISSMEFAFAMLSRGEESVDSVMFEQYMEASEGGAQAPACGHKPRRVMDGSEFAVAQPQNRNKLCAVDAWAFVRLATELLKDRHHGAQFRTILRATICTQLRGHATGIPSSLPWDIGIGYELSTEGQDPESGVLHGVYLFELKMTAFTVCPFVLFETDGKQSHTQRSHIRLKLRTTQPVAFAAIMREMSVRLVPVMSNMKMPDETIQVLKGYAGPTFTEDATVRMEKILRGVTAEFVPTGQVIDCQISVTSEDSHLSHDIVTSIRSDLGAGDTL